MTPRPVLKVFKSWMRVLFASRWIELVLLRLGKNRRMSVESVAILVRARSKR